MEVAALTDLAKNPKKYRIGVVNKSHPQPIYDLLDSMFSSNIPVESETNVEIDDDSNEYVVLLDDEGVVAKSPMEELKNGMLLVNSDLYRTGSTEIEDITIPSVIKELDESVFTVKGYPNNRKEKLILILVSRYIEWQAYKSDSGIVRASFQRLSRMKNEKSTQRVYEKLANLDIDVHLYGVPDYIPDTDKGFIVHGGRSYDFRRTWFVVHHGETENQCALVAEELESGSWKGFWTHDPKKVQTIARTIERKL